jgi:hypothetical protein
MINANLNLYILVLNKNFKYDLVSINKDSIILPSLSIDSYLDINLSLQHLFSKHITNSSMPVDFRLSDILIEETLNIYYYCFVTYETQIQNSYLFSPTSYDKYLPNLQKIIKLL